jgi:cytochrome c-type biogenesis protein CcmH/NrfG
VYQAHGEPREAERHWLTGAAHDPADETCRLALVRLYREEDRPEELLRVLEELRRIDPGDPEYPLAVGQTYVRLRQFEPAEAAFRAACRLAPKDSRGYAVLAQLYVQADRKRPDALELARTAVALEPAAQNFAVLSAAFERNGDLPGAVAAAERAVQLDPGNPQYRRMVELLKSKR